MQCVVFLYDSVNCKRFLQDLNRGKPLENEAFMFEGKNILITGANRGMGAEFVKQLLEKKPNKIVMVNRTSIGELKDERLLECSIDLSEKGACETVYEFTEEAGLKIDVLINNAGILVGDFLEAQDLDKVSKMITVNLEVPIRLSKLFMKSMIEQKSGLILNNSSVSSVMTLPGASTYAATKAGLSSFINSLREELLDTGVQLTTMITPGVKTRMYDQITEDFSSKLDLSFLTSITAEEWISYVLKKTEEGDENVRPKGSQNVSLFVAEKFPKLFRKAFRSYMK